MLRTSCVRLTPACLSLMILVSTALQPVAAADVPSVKSDRFDFFMTNRFSGRTKGFAYALVRKNRTVTEGAGGWAQDPRDGNLRMSTTVPSNIGSVSKLITGVAFMHLLRETPISGGTVNQQLDEEIRGYLPKDWRTRYGRKLRNLTFRHLLQHKSGLPREKDTKPGWPKVEYALSKGTTNPGAERLYNNNNISLMRFLIPRIAYPNETAFIDNLHAGKSRQAYWDAILPQYNALYKKYMNQFFFPKIFAGTHPVCNPYDELGPRTFAKAYADPNLIPGNLPSRAEELLEGYFPRPDACAPQGGFYFSVRQLAKFAKVYSQTDKLVSRGIRKRMMKPDVIDDRLVFNNTISTDDFVQETGTTHWVYHGGSFKGYAAAFVKLPDGHYGVAVANTKTVSSTDLASALYYAFVYATKGLPAQHLSANDKDHFAYRDGVYVTAGSSKDHDRERGLYRGSVGGGKSWDQVFDISANDRFHFAWIKDQHRLLVMRGKSDDLDRNKQPYVSRIDPNFVISQLRFVSSNDTMHFGWYDTGGNLWVSAGLSHDLAGKRRAQSVKLADGKRPHNIVAIVSNDKQHFAFYDDCTYSSGQSRNLASRYSGRTYDCYDLRK